MQFCKFRQDEPVFGRILSTNQTRKSILLFPEMSTNALCLEGDNCRGPSIYLTLYSRL